jgi:hypothetical protein
VLHDLAIVRAPEVFAYFLFIIPISGGVHKHDPHRCQAASPLGNSCFPRTYSTRSRIEFFLRRVNRASGCLRQIAISSSRTVIHAIVERILTRFLYIVQI